MHNMLIGVACSKYKLLTRLSVHNTLTVHAGTQEGCKCLQQHAVRMPMILCCVCDHDNEMGPAFMSATL